MTPSYARYVRVRIDGADTGASAGIRELDVVTR